MDTSEVIATFVDRGLAIVAEIEALEKELKQIEAGLSTAALSASKDGRTEALVDEEREGHRYMAEGTEKTLPVILESDQISGEFSEDSEKATKLKDLCGHRLNHLYKRTVVYARVPKDGKAFRAAAAAHWPPDEAAKIISAAISRDKHGIPKSRVVVAWNQAK